MNTDQLKLILDALSKAGNGACWAFGWLLAEDFVVQLLWWGFAVFVIRVIYKLITRAMN